jgi:hypothetical protein
MKPWLRILIMVSFLGAGGFAAAQEPEVLNVDQKISVRVENVTLGRFLELWDQATGMQSTVPPALADQKLSIRFTGLSLNDALRRIFDGQPFGYFLADGRLIVSAISQSDSLAEPMPVDNDNGTEAVEPQVLPTPASLQAVPSRQKPTVMPTPFGPLLIPPGSQQPFIQLPPVPGAASAPPFFAPSLPTTPPAGAPNGPPENNLFGPLPIFQNPSLPALYPNSSGVFYIR